MTETLLSLPNELLASLALAGSGVRCKIFRSFILSYKDVYSLILVCRRLRCLFLPELYCRNRNQDDGDVVIWAIQQDRTETLETALCFGLDIHHVGSRSTLHEAAKVGRDNIITWLVDRGADVDCTSLCSHHKYRRKTSALHVAFHEAHASTALRLLSHGASLRYPDPDRRTRDRHAVMDALQAGLFELLLLIVERTGSDLYEAGMGENDAVVKALAGLSPALTAETLRLLVQRGIDINGPGPGWRESYLSRALALGYTQVAMVLLEHGARIDPFYVPRSNSLPWEPAPMRDFFKGHRGLDALDRGQRLLQTLREMGARDDPWGFRARVGWVEPPTPMI
ncbi:ankyrin repeat-containing domain protein [Coniella lustricola]|uniref:Ankyrin repeat-containing domain protein n=1 Tax=Coniella lustricola TaxID=2025994 RepID=A0A2T3A2B0_9PEZI|nr:ankyrin repeat-containing domain protein [Coniella lustricola]